MRKNHAKEKKAKEAKTHFLTQKTCKANKYEKVFHFISYQRNANYNYGIPFYRHKTDRILKIRIF